MTHELTTHVSSCVLYPYMCPIFYKLNCKIYLGRIKIIIRGGGILIKKKCISFGSVKLKDLTKTNKPRKGQDELFMCYYNRHTTFDAISRDAVMHVDFALHWLLAFNMHGY